MRTSHILLPSVMVESSTPVRNPTSLPFLRAKLFNFLTDNMACVATPNVVIVTKEEDAVSNCTINLAGPGVALCSHEEADAQIFMHDRHATEAGFSSMPSLAAMSFQHYVAKGRSPVARGKPGMFVMRLPVSSANSASIHR